MIYICSNCAEICDLVEEVVSFDYAYGSEVGVHRDNYAVSDCCNEDALLDNGHKVELQKRYIRRFGKNRNKTANTKDL